MPQTHHPNFSKKKRPNWKKRWASPQTAPHQITKKPLMFLIYGRTGWIGSLPGKLCHSQGIDFTYAAGRLQDRASLEDHIAAAKPIHVFNAAGVTGHPGVDWCESHMVDTIQTNVVVTLTLADVCGEKGLILINCHGLYIRV
uniref:NAD-dependent epimerase/dehydratase domain-containing protein n=1 Tax=Rhizophora mucronata TaxID=61149 RepID=A0A2P2IHU7_RHIMU